MKNRYYIFALFALSLASCSTEDTVETLNSAKTPILVGASIGDNSGTTATRASGENLAFNAGVNVCMQVIGSWTKSGGTVTIVNPIVTGTTVAAASGKTTNSLTFTGTNQLYWDDYGTADPNNSGGRTAGLTIYAVACPDGGTSTPTPTDFTKVLRSLGTTQSNWATNDLMISNNINGSSTKYTFDNSTLGTVPASLEFKHALSKITVNLIKGDGFSDAEVTTGLDANVVLSNLNYEGTINVEDGTVTPTTAGDITMYKASTNSTNLTTNPYATFVALAMPNSTTAQFVNGQKILSITVNGNNYIVNGDKIVTAINTAKGEPGTSKNLESGKNYIFNIKIGKTAIKTEAYMVDWVDVNADLDTPSNATAATFTTSMSNGSFNQSYDLWSNTATSATAASDKLNPFTNVNTYTYSGSSYTATNTIYWPDNSTYYHFRGLSPTSTAVTADATSGDYATLTTVIDNGHTDVMWGAPYSDASTISTALGPTSNAIPLVFYHKMAQVLFVTETTTGGSAVDLTTAPTINLKCNKYGCLRLGDGTVNGQNTPATFTPTYHDSYTINSKTYKGYLIGVVPQDVPTTKEGLTITTTDKNVYPVVMSTLKDASNNLITKWEPGKIYIYTLKLQKTKIEATASVVNWTVVSGASTNVYINP